MTTASTVGATLAWLQLMRAPALLSAASNLIAAHWLATGGAVEPRALLLLTLSGLTLYTGGMILNDCFDRVLDSVERPARPLPSGRISATAAWCVGWLCLAAGVLLAALYGYSSMLIAAALVVAIVCYNGGSKSTWLGPVNMGVCRSLNWLLGLSVVALTPALLPIVLPIFFYVVALTFVSRIEADAQARGPLVPAAVGLVLTAGTIEYLYLTDVLPNVAMPVLAGVGLVLVLSRIGKTWRTFTPANAQATVTFMIFGIIPLDALLLAGAGQWWAALALLLLLVPGRMLGRRIYIT